MTESDKTTSSSEKGGESTPITREFASTPERSSSSNRDMSSAAGKHTISATRSEKLTLVCRLLLNLLIPGHPLALAQGALHKLLQLRVIFLG